MSLVIFGGKQHKTARIFTSNTGSQWTPYKINVQKNKFRVRSMNSKPAGYPRFRLFTPNPPDFFFLERSLTKKNQADPLASMLAD